MCIYGVASERVGRPVAATVPRHEGRVAQLNSTPLWITTLLCLLKSPAKEPLCDSSARTVKFCHHLVSPSVRQRKMVLKF